MVSFNNLNINNGQSVISTTTPLHGPTHQNLGTDEIATTIPTANAIPKALADGRLNRDWVNPPSAVIEVFGLSDLPAASGGFIDVAPDTLLLLYIAILNIGANSIRCAGRLFIEGAGNQPGLFFIVSSAATPTIISNGGFSIDGLALNNTVGPCIEWNPRVSPAFDVCNIDNCTLIGAAVSVFNGATGARALTILGGQMALGDKGIIIKGEHNVLEIIDFGFIDMDPNATFIEIETGATFAGTVKINENSFLTDSVGQTALKIAADIAPAAIGRVIDNSINAPGTALSGITPANLFWRFRDNGAEIANSTIIGKIGFKDNATPTVIADPNTRTPIVGTRVLSAGAQRVRLHADGISAEIISKEPAVAEVKISARVNAGAVNQDFKFNLLVNDDPVAGEFLTVTRGQAQNSGFDTFTVDIEEGMKIGADIENSTSDEDGTVIDLGIAISVVD